ncbi:hypothetical protein ACT0XK_003548 [Cronobacter sakazakii]|uniref:hypothetical protein n=1 Tax=Cronobacter sakazakii TaxID=28141 RepID=UPI0010543D7F|nr:hypothetical protein [Cronobacter sakazakii]ELY5945185.1 hypothetical protein [Cronobacter turicensis]EJV9473483.1 hypothetical protein [Cronobacter sakazakii]EKK7733721.1 hypothetical protein [Cronobacter sakazakii]ELY4123918.1 hypothetical protein [Cronobacter sakazakii]ELY6251566.1 hypothetical protein [Cronobacter sakazakii]
MTTASRARTDRDPTYWQGGRLLLTGEKPAAPDDNHALQVLILDDAADWDTCSGFDANSEAGLRRLALIREAAERTRQVRKGVRQ